MRVDIRDRALLMSLDPLEVAGYLRSRGWQEGAAQWPNSAHFTYGDDYEINVPLSTQLRDFCLRMSDVLKTLEIVENRGQLEVFADLKGSAGAALASVVRELKKVVRNRSGTHS